MKSEVSAGIVSKGKSVLMHYDESSDTWDIPTEKCEKGELSSDAAKRAINDLTESEIESIRYRNKLKHTFNLDGEEITVQSFAIEIEEDPQNGQWVRADELGEKNLAPAASNMREKLVDKIA